MRPIPRSAFVRGIAAAAAVSASPLRAFAASQNPRVQQIVDAYLQQNAARKNLAIVAGIVRPDSPAGVLVFGGSPVAAREHSRALPLDGDTRFLIGSNTKCFTSRVYAARQKDYGKLLGDCITVALPSRLRGVSILDFANYSSGFPTDNAPPIWWNDTIDATSLPALMKSLNANPSLPSCSPGTGYSYSNFSWGLMGLAAIGISSLDQPVAEQWAHAIADLGREIGLSANTTPWSPSLVDALPAGYAPNGSLFEESQDYGGPNWLTMGGGGNLASTGNDMLRWLRYNMGLLEQDVALLHEQQLRTWTWPWRVAQSVGVRACQESPMSSPVTTSLGWFHSQPSWNPDVRLLTKNGGVRGFSSWMGFQRWGGSTPSGYGAFVIANAPRAADVVGAHVMRAIFS